MRGRHAFAMVLGLAISSACAWYLTRDVRSVQEPGRNDLTSGADHAVEPASSSAPARAPRPADTDAQPPIQADAQSPVQDLTIEELEHLSGRGHAHASHELFRRAWECQSIDLQLDSLSDDVSAGRVSTGEAERTLSVLDQRTETCASHGIRKGRYRDWLRLAAQQGNQEAMVQFASFPPWETGDALELIARSAEIEAFKAEAMGFLNAAASSGNADALNTLGHAYHDGLLVTADPVRAAAYMRAASLSGLVTSADVLFNNWTSGMTPDERATVEAFAREILLDCCSG